MRVEYEEKHGYKNPMEGGNEKPNMPLKTAAFIICFGLLVYFWENVCEWVINMF